MQRIPDERTVVFGMSDSEPQSDIAANFVCHSGTWTLDCYEARLDRGSSSFREQRARHAMTHGVTKARKQPEWPCLSPFGCSSADPHKY